MNTTSDDNSSQAEETIESFQPEAVQGAIRTVAIVESDSIIRGLVTYLLERNSFLVRALVPSAGTTAMLAAEDFDVLVLEPSGNDVLSWIANVRPEMLSRLVILKGEQDWGTELPVHAILTKPLEVGELLRIVNGCATLAAERPLIRRCNPAAARS